MKIKTQDGNSTEVNVGDRIVLLHTSGDSSVFTVSSVSPGYLESQLNAYDTNHVQRIEILKRFKKPYELPTEPGLYVPDAEDYNYQSKRIFKLNINGRWTEKTAPLHEETKLLRELNQMEWKLSRLVLETEA